MIIIGKYTEKIIESFQLNIGLIKTFSCLVTISQINY